jgi:hypothetical protein
MVRAGAAEVHNSNGKVKAVKLTRPASHFSIIGPPGEGGVFGVRFTRREVLEESGTGVWAHHPRCTYQ